jgi:hypothetical protein
MVYVLVYTPFGVNEGSDVVSVFKSKERAEAAADLYNERAADLYNERDRGGWGVQECELED